MTVIEKHTQKACRDRNSEFAERSNDAFRKIFHFKRFESVRSLQVEFGTVDFQHLYDLQRWEFLKSIGDW